MHTLTVKLKQHTPLIHFQHDQEGATLRASEVKPKLDKFILTRLGNDDYQAGIELAKSKGWLVGKGDHPALDYKMRIETEDNSQREEYLMASYIKEDKIIELSKSKINAISNSPYFAQEKQNGEIIKSKQPDKLNKWNHIEKKGIIESGYIIVKIIGADSIIFLTNNIQSFFLTTNFGTRQSKGFGSFEAINITLDDKNIPLKPIEELLINTYSFVYKKSLRVSDLNVIFKTINEDYKLLKSGSTFPRYAKSKLMLYAESLNNNIGWDKKYIKVKTKGEFESEKPERPYVLRCREENKKKKKKEKKDYKYYRALLGLAEQFEFLLENPPQGNSRNKMIVKVKNDDIQRYQSPILFKVIGKDIYLVGNEISKEMLNKSFVFLVNFQGDDCYVNEPIDEGNPIKTPESFSLKEFISFAMKDNTNNASLGYVKIKG